jgi:hypothetical protein
MVCSESDMDLGPKRGVGCEGRDGVAPFDGEESWGEWEGVDAVDGRGRGVRGRGRRVEDVVGGQVPFHASRASN